MQTLAREISKAQTFEGYKTESGKCTQTCLLVWFALIISFWEVLEKEY